MPDIIYSELCEILGDSNVKKDEPMSIHTTFRAGGKADYFVTPENKKELLDVLNYVRANELEHYVTGNGSNLLVRDRGYQGIIINIGNKLSEVNIEGCHVTAGAGILLSRLAKCIYEKSLTGFEFASGIPGTLGGAVCMNAGAYDGEMKDILESAEVIDNKGNIIVLKADELKLSYRNSIIQEKKYIVISAKLNLKMGNQSDIKAKQEDFANRRRTKQPLEFPSAGSTFKRPEGYYAGKLIEDAGLRGYTVGGAMVSQKHCGFVINADNATASEIEKIITDVISKVKDISGVTLEPEVKIIG